METIFLEIKEAMFIALRAIRANKIRSMLTMLGIVIGVASVVLMTTAIKGNGSPTMIGGKCATAET